jgi:hypothetical protein
MGFHPNSAPLNLSECELASQMYYSPTVLEHCGLQASYWKGKWPSLQKKELKTTGLKKCDTEGQANTFQTDCTQH